jgi:hypothetical protein
VGVRVALKEIRAGNVIAVHVTMAVRSGNYYQLSRDPFGQPVVANVALGPMAGLGQ